MAVGAEGEEAAMTCIPALILGASGVLLLIAVGVFLGVLMLGRKVGK